MATDTERMLNTGITVTTKGFGDVQVREFSLGVLTQHGRDIVELFKALPENLGKEGEDGLTSFMGIIENPQVFKVLCIVGAACTGLTLEQLKVAGISDWIKLISAMIKVIDFGEIAELFQLLVKQLPGQVAGGEETPAVNG